MADLQAIMHAKFAVQAIREQFNARMDEVEAILDEALPKDEPKLPPGLPSTIEGRKKYYKDKWSKSHGRRVRKRT